MSIQALWQRLRLDRGKGIELPQLPATPDALINDTMTTLDQLVGNVPPLRILISPLTGDSTGRGAEHISQSLSGRRGITCRFAERPLSAPGADNMQPFFLSMAVDLGRRWLTREDADLLIWGEAITGPSLGRDGPPHVSWRLRFVSAGTPVQAYGASLSPLERLELPAFYNTAAGELVFGAALAAVNVESAEGLRTRARMFRLALEAATHHAEGDMLGTVAEGATAQVCYAALLLLDGARTGDLKLLERAIAVYQGALILGTDAFGEHERAMIGSHIADALMMIADIGGRPKLLSRCIDYYRTALGMVRKEIFGEEFAGLKTRLGSALHALAAANAQTAPLREAAECYAAATTIWTITETPQRWADIQNSLGGLLVTMGRLSRQPSLFDKAVTIFTRIAEVQTRTTAPLVFATTLANIGAALREKGMAAQNADILQRAAEAFNQAGEVFSELHLDNNAQIVQSHRAQVLQLINEQTFL